MMRAIAEFAMRSRGHAIAVSVIAAVLPLLGWISTVIVALVTLRQGATAGVMLLLWTALPYGVSVYLIGDPSPAILLVGTALLAMVLRTTVSWEQALVAASVLAALGTVIFEITAIELLDEVMTIYLETLKQVNPDVVLLPEQVRTLGLGLLSLMLVYGMIIMLLMARWCQSELYNPGGFRKEFHGLRLSLPVSMGLCLAIAGCFAFGELLGRWIGVVTAPLVIVALGLVHWIATERSLSKGWLAGFYMLLVLFPQLVLPFLITGAVLDSWYDIRNRMKLVEKD